MAICSYLIKLLNLSRFALLHRRKNENLFWKHGIRMPGHCTFTSDGFCTRTSLPAENHLMTARARRYLVRQAESLYLNGHPIMYTITQPQLNVMLTIVSRLNIKSPHARPWCLFCHSHGRMQTSQLHTLHRSQFNRAPTKKTLPHRPVWYILRRHHRETISQPLSYLKITPHLYATFCVL